MAPRLVPSRNGWAEWRDERSPATVHIRFEPTGNGRLEPTELHLRMESGLGSEAVRAIPVSRISAAANVPDVRDALLANLGEPDDGEYHVLGARPDGLPAPAWRRLADDLAERLPSLVEEEETHTYELPARRAPNLHLPVEQGRARSDRFYELVADRYTWLAVRTRRPAAELAEANDVPVTTAHRWIKEARRRGLLAPGRRGAAG